MAGVTGAWSSKRPTGGGVYAIAKRRGVCVHFQIRRGAIIIRAPGMAPYGIREFEVEDLNGYRITFGESA